MPTLIRTRPYNFALALARRGHAITLATVWENEHDRASLRELETAGLRVIAAPLTRAQIGVNLARAFLAGKPLQALYCWSPALARQIETESAHGAYDVIHVEHLRGAEYGFRARHQPVVWDSVDCISFLFDQAARVSRNPFGKIVTRLELPRTRAHEVKLIGAFTRAIVTSEKDKIAFVELTRRFSHNGSAARADQIAVVPNGVDLNYFAPTAAPRDPQTIVMTGKMSYHANATAAMYLVNEVMPRVWAHAPDARVMIVGHRPPRAITALAQKDPARVTVTGAVPDVRPFLARATLAVAPIVYGAGIQNKALEAMAMATPVVATPQAVSAIGARSEHDLLVGADADELAHQVVRVLNDPDLRVSIGARGRAYVEQHHDWDRIILSLEAIYLRAIAEHRARI